MFNFFFEAIIAFLQMTGTHFTRFNFNSIKQSERRGKDTAHG